MKATSIRYPIAIEPGTDHTAWGVAVPDLPGCFSAGDTFDEALDNAHKAVEAWIDAVIEDGGAIPPPGPIEAHYSDPEFAGWTWGIVEIDPMRIDTSVERVNVTLPRRVLARLDAIARAHGESRSGTIARLALEADA
ncbi:MAG TPA: type II toxin-antitoxin system HicB family antitoxin [Candidatus Acidoferrales bacterium]|nr:type II toxin-antitoxin system HicB family antitoxin [Candidatus Acidoferrales bacterium]